MLPEFWESTFNHRTERTMKDLVAIILAAGEGKRMKSATAKILHPLAGKPLLFYPLDAARKVKAQKIIVVAGYQGEKVKRTFPDEDIIFVTQWKQWGTGHAAACARDVLTGFKGHILILCGDIPLIKEATLETLIARHQEEKNLATVLTATMQNPTGYGRIVRNHKGLVQKIIEEKDATAQEKEIAEINSGIYCFDAQFLFEALESLSRKNAQNEYYLTDTIAIARDQGKNVGAVCIADEIEVMGINNRIELAQASEVMRMQILEKLMLEGVSLINPKDTYIDFGVTIGKDTVICPNTFLMGTTEIGEDCLIEPGCHIQDSKIGSQVTVRLASVIHESIIRDRATIGPFAHIRPGSDVGEGARIGNFVEVKKSTIGKGSKASHLTYLGDTTVGSEVNVGAGTITCNFDGVSKHKTIIEDGVFIGSNTELVAPVKIGRGALIGAGSTITRDVPPEHLAISRTKQVNLNRKPFLGKKEEKES
jgi:bifunctional UDP-N-acetylglucosamine pyrophosphorylase / glucosamine-1-phosphate N-acetyltransferase